MTSTHDAGTSVAGAIIEHPQHGFLLQLRDKHAPSWPLYWSLFGGHLEPGETPEVALWRELAEELTFTPGHALACELVQRNPRPQGGTQYIYYILTHATPDDLVLGEGKAMAYVPAADLFDYRLAANGERIFRDHLAGRRDAQP